MIKIELAEINDIDGIMKMIQNCANDLISKNIFQWNEKYPSRDVFLIDIEKKNLFIFKNNSGVVGCVALVLTPNQNALGLLSVLLIVVLISFVIFPSSYTSAWKSLPSTISVFVGTVETSVCQI